MRLSVVKALAESDFSCHHKLSSQPHHCKVFVYSYLTEVSTTAASLGTKILSKLKCRRKRKIICHLCSLNFFSPPPYCHLPTESGLFKVLIFRSQCKIIRRKDSFSLQQLTYFTLLLTEMQNWSVFILG